MFIHWCIANIKEQYLICAGHNGIKLEVILKSWKIHKSVEIKQTAHEQPTGQRRNQERERKKKSWSKQKQKHSRPNVCYAV